MLHGWMFELCCAAGKSISNEISLEVNRVIEIKFKGNLAFYYLYEI